MNRDELLGRIGELELGHKILDAQRKKHREAREQAEATIEAKERIIATLVSERRANRKLLEQAEAELTRLRAVNEALSGVIKQADEELAERDRMLHAVFTESMGLKPGALSEKGWLAYLRSRAEEGHEGIDEDAPICPECRVSDVMGTGTKHLRSCSRADEAKP